ncbi:MAG: tetratricopeptide repeat protein [Emcibacteraceae bacterium]|nr:tetratricopeptide repeat protein [Emcibacteraceae bacterium]
MSDAFIREVDEDIRQKQINELWRKYGKFVIGIAVGIVVIVAGREIYTSVVEGKYTEQAELYNNAVSLNEAEIAAALDPVISGGVDGYEVLAVFKKVEIALGNEDHAAAVTLLDDFAKSSNVQQIYKDIANLQAALLELDSASVDQIRGRLALILNGGNKYQSMAAEIVALAELKAGETDAAKARLEAIVADEMASGSIKTRAEQYLSVIE